MFNHVKYNTLTTNTTNSDIMTAIITNNLNKLKTLINKNNVNIIINNENNYTSLHYAIMLTDNINIIKYLLELDADISLTENRGLNSYDLSLKYSSKIIFEYIKEKQQNKINNLKINNNSLLLNIDTLKKTNSHLNDTIDGYNKKINNLNDIITDNNDIITDNNNIITDYNNKNKNLKRDLDESERAFNNLLKKSKK